MLYSIRGTELSQIVNVPYQGTFKSRIKLLDPLKYTAIRNTLNNMIDGDEVHTSSWMPSKHWHGTVFYPLYDEVCRRNEEEAAKFFGQIVFKMFMDRTDHWSFGKYELDNKPIKGTTYFRIDPAKFSKIR